MSQDKDGQDPFTALLIENDAEKITNTNFWGGEYDRHDLFYLSANAGTLRLLVPSSRTDDKAQILTGKAVTIEPAQGLPEPYCDLVFEDGTNMPFFISINKDKQCDRKLDSGETKMIVYFSLSDSVVFTRCKIF